MHIVIKLSSNKENTQTIMMTSGLKGNLEQ